MSFRFLWYDGPAYARMLMGDLTPDILPGSFWFTTKIHGGFDQCGFVLRCGLPRSWQWLHRYHMHHLEIVNSLAGVSFEGRISGVRLHPVGVELLVHGYGVAATKDQVYSYAGEAAWDINDVVVDALDNYCPDLSSDRSHIDANIMDVADDWDFDEYPLDVITMLCARGDTSGDAPYCFAVWDERVPWYWKKDTSAADWIVERGMVLPGGLTLGRSDEDIWTRVKARYVDPVANAGIQSTAWTTDTTGPLGSMQRDRAISIPYADITGAEYARDLFLVERHDTKLRLGISIGHWVRQNWGSWFPSWVIRAGDVVDFSDLTPLESSIEAASVSSTYRAFVVGTRWDSRGLTILPDLEPDMAAVLMEQLGASQTDLVADIERDRSRVVAGLSPYFYRRGDPNPP